MDEARMMPRTNTCGQTSPVTPPLVQIPVLLAGRSASNTGALVVEFHGPV
jgi:hypothetical protein